jgi:hypothetical protein
MVVCGVCCTVQDKRQNQDNRNKDVQIKHREQKEITPRTWMSVFCVCCQVEVFALGRSLVQSSPTECGVSICVI